MKAINKRMFLAWFLAIILLSWLMAPRPIATRIKVGPDTCDSASSPGCVSCSIYAPYFSQANYFVIHPDEQIPAVQNSK